MNTRVKGFIYLLLSAVYFGFMPLLVKVICADGSAIVGAQDAAILSTFEPVTSMIVGILVLHESASLSSMAGCILILISVTATAFAKS